MKTNKSRKTSAATLVVWLAASATALAMASPMMPTQKSEFYQQAQAALVRHGAPDPYILHTVTNWLDQH